MTLQILEGLWPLISHRSKARGGVIAGLFMWSPLLQPLLSPVSALERFSAHLILLILVGGVSWSGRGGNAACLLDWNTLHVSRRHALARWSDCSTKANMTFNQSINTHTHTHAW